MSAVAAIPALALLAGCAGGLFLPGQPAFLQELALAGAAIGAVHAWRRSRSRLLSGFVAASFFFGGSLLAARAWRDAWRPPLRVAFDAIARRQRAEADAEGRLVSEDDVITMAIAGRLRSDASLTPFGASLSVDVRELASPEPEATAGGVQLSVVGELGRDHINEWRAGRSIHATAQLRRPSRYLDPGVPDEEKLLARRGTSLVGTIKSAALVDVVSRGSRSAEIAAAVRAFARRTIADAVGRWSPEAAGIVTAIVIGDRAGLTPDVQQRLQEAGTYHVIAISGSNIAILVGVTLWTFRITGALRRAPPVSLITAMLALVAYGDLVGGGASVDRATLMAVLYLGGRVLDQRAAPLNVLAVVAALLVAADPLTLADPAFLLTFGATAAIVASIPALDGAARLPRAANPVLAMLAASVASEAALLPIGAAIFSRVTFAGLALNFAAIPLMAIAQLAGMALVPAALVSRHMAAALGWVAFAGARGLVLSANLVRFAPALTWRVAPPGWTPVVVYYAGLITAWGCWRWRAVRRPAIACVVAAGVWIAGQPWRVAAALGDGRLHITFLDVGQGDSAFIRFPHGASMLIDAGGLASGSSFDMGDRVVAPVLRESGVAGLDSVVLTHGDNDHIGGGASILREFRPHDVWEGIPVPPFVPLRALHDIADETGARWTTVQTADRVSIDQVDVIVRHPGLPDWERQRVRNDDSIVIELRWRDVSVVLTGDIGAEAEREVAPLLDRVPIRVVKVPHHGSLTSSTVPFIAALAPRAAVISVGRSNAFGHPARDVIERYRAVGASVFRTDQDGAVSMETDGKTVDLKTFTGRVLTIK